MQASAFPKPSLLGGWVLQRNARIFQKAFLPNSKGGMQQLSVEGPNTPRMLLDETHYLINSKQI